MQCTHHHPTAHPLGRNRHHHHHTQQVLGSIFGALIYTSLIPALHIGSGEGSPGCFAPGNGVSAGGVFGWETMMTFLLVMTVYAAAVAKPGHGNTAPLAIGLSLYAAAISGGLW
jgi:aquaporin TIP